MVRNSYRVNSEVALETGRALQICSRRSPGFVPLPEEWIIKWDHFFEINGSQVVPNFSRRLRPNFSPIMRSEYFFAPLNPRIGSNGDAAGLPNRDLVSGIYARIWSVPKLIDALRTKSNEIASFLPTYGQYAPALTDWLNATANPSGISEQFGPGDVSAIADDPPLPFFVLHEAFRCHGGERLGPLGSIIVAETFLAAMNDSRMRVAELKLDPFQDIKDQAQLLKRLGVTDEAISRIPDLFSFEELLEFMRSEGLIETQSSIVPQ
jgi:hypothetical protein